VIGEGRLTRLCVRSYLFFMLKPTVALLITLSQASLVHGQQPNPEARQPQSPQQQESYRGYISPSEVNVNIDADVRTLVVMAAINIAGFDYETGGQPLSPARAQIRRDLANLDPQIKQKLTAFYKTHRRPDVDEGVDALRYAALSLLMTPPPAFSIYQPIETIPDDLRLLLDNNFEFVKLIEEFYLKSGIKQLIPKYLSVAKAYSAAYHKPIGEVIFDTLSYFHTRPETIINLKPLVIGSAEAGGKKQKLITRTRTRQVFVVLDPLLPLASSFVRGDILNQKEDLLSRRVGDDYIVVIGPSKTPNTDAVRMAMIRFVIDPIVERHLKSALDYKDQIVKLVATVPTAEKEFRASVYLVVRESLAQASDARLKRIQAMEGRGSYGEDDATYDLARAYLRGAVLSFHFYQSLIGFEKVGISIEDFFDQMLATTKFDREADRAKEFEPVIARRSNAAKPAIEASVDPIIGMILASDDLIRQRRFAEARPILEQVLAKQPNNARALYGLAQVISQTPTGVELDPNADENDKIQAQHDRLEQAIKLYRKAIENASPETERWLIQWSHVLIGRILDFQEFRADAIAEYEKAIALGDVPNGAYREALEGKQRPYSPK
jgi:tetratricopeptide (TPR) repeat protein